MSWVWPILRRARITSSRREEQLDVDQGIGTFLMDRSVRLEIVPRGADEGRVMGLEDMYGGGGWIRDVGRLQ